MSRSQNQSNSFGNDVFTPIIESFAELFQTLLEMLAKLCQYLFNKARARYLEKYRSIYVNDPIQVHQLGSRKKAKAPDAFAYSVSRRRAFGHKDFDGQKHTAIIGSTGSGKSVCMEQLIVGALQKGRPIILFDPKPSLHSIEQFRTICASFGQSTYVVSELLKNSQKFNPLAEGSSHEITNRIMGALDWSDSYYQNEAERVLFECCLQIEREGGSLSVSSILDKLETYHDRKSISGLYSQLKAIHLSEFSDFIEANKKESLSFSQVRLEKSCLYIGISAIGIGNIGLKVNKLFFGSLVNHSKDAFNGKIEGLGDPLQSPIAVFFDELSSTVNKGFIDLQNKCRSSGLQLTYATQCPSDLDRVSPEFTRQVFENTNNFFVFNQVVPAHTELFASFAGTTRTIKKTYAVEDNRRSQYGSEREVEEFVAHANIFRSLRVGQCVFIQRTPKRIDLLNVTQHQPLVGGDSGKRPATSAVSIFSN